MLNIKKVLLLVLSLILLIGVVSATDNTTSQDQDNIKISTTQATNTTIKDNDSCSNTQKQIKNSTTNIEDNKIKKNSPPKTNTVMSFTNTTTTYKNEIKLMATVKTSNLKNVTGGYVVFKINDKTIGRANLLNSKAYLTYKTNNDPATYKITVKYSGTSKYAQCQDTNGYLKITKLPAKISVPNKTVTANEKVQLTASVTDSKNNPINSGRIAFKLNGKTVGHANVVNGKATLIINTKLYAPKNYKLTATLGETKKTLKATSKTANLKIKPVPVEISVTNKTIYKSHKVQLEATAVNKQTREYMNSGKFLFKINDKTLGYATVKNGKAYYTYHSSNLESGTYYLTAIYVYPNGESTRVNGHLKVEKLTFTYTQIKDAAINIRNHYEANQIIERSKVGSIEINVHDIMPMILHALKNVKAKKSSTPVEYVYYEKQPGQADTIKGQTFKLNAMLSIASDVLNYYQVHKTSPKYIKVNSQKFGFYNMLYSFCKMIDVSTSTYLPATCKVYNWNRIHPSNPKERTIYITSDNILSKSKDQAFMNKIKTELNKRGYKVVTGGIGPNSHNTKIRGGSLADNAVQLSIFGGADAGVIRDITTRSFMRAKANVLLFQVYYPTAKDITGLKWLERAHDDNYSPSSFKGIAYPDKYLQQHGYDYVYSGNVKTIVDELIKYIS